MAQPNILIRVHVVFGIKQEYLMEDMFDEAIRSHIEIIPDEENYDAFFSVKAVVDGQPENDDIHLEMKGNAKLILQYAQQFLAGNTDEN